MNQKNNRNIIKLNKRKSRELQKGETHMAGKKFAISKHGYQTSKKKVENF